MVGGGGGWGTLRPPGRRQRKQGKKKKKKKPSLIAFSHEIPPSSDLHPAERRKLTLRARDDERVAGGGRVEGSLGGFCAFHPPDMKADSWA